MSAARERHRCYLSPYGCKLTRLYAWLEARGFRPALRRLNGTRQTLPEPVEERALQTVDRNSID